MFSIPKEQDWGARDPWMLSGSYPSTLALILGSEVNMQQPGSARSLIISTQSNLNPSYAPQVLHINIVIVLGTRL